MMPTALLNMQTSDGSRWFGALPQRLLWHDIRDHVAKLQGAQLTGFVTDGVTEAWIDFRFCGHSFTINDQFGEYCFFVRESSCPDNILSLVVSHFGDLLASSPQKARK